MSFAKKFPSLVRTFTYRNTPKQKYLEISISECCLDKQKVAIAFEHIKIDIRTDANLSVETERSLIKGIELEEKRLGIYGLIK